MKTCYVCKQTKDIGSFYEDKSQCKGYSSACRECSRAKNRAWRDKNKQKASDYRKQYYKDNRARRIEVARDMSFKKRYGISLQEYEACVLLQSNKCLICGSNRTSRRLAVDHCHKTGKIRGLLCSKCNLGLGNFDDNIDFLSKAIQYLKSA